MKDVYMSKLDERINNRKNKKINKYKKLRNFKILSVIFMINLETKIAYFPIKQCFIGYKYIFVCYIDASQNE